MGWPRTITRDSRLCSLLISDTRTRKDLDSEYLNIFENPHTDARSFRTCTWTGVRVMLIIGPTGTGKSVHGNQIISLEQKYGGFTYIFRYRWQLRERC